MRYNRGRRRPGTGEGVALTLASNRRTSLIRAALLAALAAALLAAGAAAAPGQADPTPTTTTPATPSSAAPDADNDLVTVDLPDLPGEEQPPAAAPPESPTSRPPPVQPAAQPPSPPPPPSPGPSTGSTSRKAPEPAPEQTETDPGAPQTGSKQDAPKRTPSPTAAAVAAVEQASTVSAALAHAAREIRDGAPERSPSMPRTTTRRTAPRHATAPVANDTFLPPVARSTVPPASDGDRVSEAPFALMFVSLTVLLLAAVPERVLADAGFKGPERIRAALLLAGCAGLLLALVLLLASA